MLLQRRTTFGNRNHQKDDDGLDNKKLKRRTSTATTTVTTTRLPVLLWLTVVVLCSLSSLTLVEARRQQRNNRPNKPQKPKESDYYATLGVRKSSSAKEIKSAYRKLALELHPDKQPADLTEAQKEQAQERFMQVQAAYDILSDDEKRKVYDKYGKQGLEMLESGQDPSAFEHGFGGGFGGGGGGEAFEQFFGGGAGGFGFEDILSQAFGGGGGFGGGHAGGGGGGGHQQFFQQGFGSGGGGHFQQGFGGGGGRQQQRRPQGADGPQLFPLSGKVARLGSPKFPGQTSKHMWLVMFYDNDRGYQEAAQVKPQLELLVDKIKGNFKVGAMDCGKNKKEEQFCRQEFDLDVPHELPQLGFVVHGHLEWYDDEDELPSARNLYEFALQHMPKDLITNVNQPQQLHSKVLQPLTTSSTTKPEGAILLLTDKYETSTLYYSLAYKYRTNYRFAESKAKSINLGRELGVKKYPSLVALFSKADFNRLPQEAVPYQEDYFMIWYATSQPLNQESLSKWVDKLPSPTTKTSSSGRQQRSSSSSSSSHRREF